MKQEAKVGIFVVVALLILAYGIIQIGALPSFKEDKRYPILAVLDTVPGLREGDRVLYAGIRIGDVGKIKLEEGKAWVTLRIKQDVKIPVTAKARLVMIGLLGEKYIEVRSTDKSEKFLKPGDQLQTEKSVDLNTMMFDIKDLGDNALDISFALRESFRDEEGRNRLARIFDNLDHMAKDLKVLIGENKQNVDNIFSNFKTLSADLQNTLPETVDKLNALTEKLDLFMEDNRDSLGISINNFKDLTEELKESVNTMNRILKAVEEQEGTIGKLIYDDTAHDKLTSTLESAEETVKKAENMAAKFSGIGYAFGVRSEYFKEDEDLKNFFGFELRPSDRGDFLLFEIVDDNVGRYRDIQGRRFIDGREEDFGYAAKEEDVTFSAQYGRRFGRFSLRGGMIESELGGAVGMNFWDDRLYVDFQGFDLARDGGPHLKFSSHLTVYRNFFVSVGVDDFSDDDESQVFFGTGLWFD